MLKVKNNYKNWQNNILCRMCKITEETENHILEECQGLRKHDSTKVTKQIYLMKKSIIIITMNKLEQHNY